MTEVDDDLVVPVDDVEVVFDTPRDQAVEGRNLIRELEDRFVELVRLALDHVATQAARTFAGPAADVPPLVAAGDPLDDGDLSALTRAWIAQVPSLADALADIYAAVGDATIARVVQGQSGLTVTAFMRDQYLRGASNRLTLVGDDLWNEARNTLADGTLRGEGYDVLRARLRDTFAEGGVELGESRATRIARTEVQSAVNRGTTDAVTLLPESSRPSYKVWVATLDRRTRDDHMEADGQVVPLDAPFVVGGEELFTPGDPSGSPGNVINCRCTVIFQDTEDPPTDTGRQYLSEQQIDDVLSYYDERGVTRAGDLAAAAHRSMPRTRPDGGGTVGDHHHGGPMSTITDDVEVVSSDTMTEPEAAIHTARLRGLTLCDISAFTEATIAPTGPVDDNGFMPVEGVAVVEGIPTGDARVYVEGCFRWEDPTDLGYPLRWDVEDDGMHLGAVTVGRVDEFIRDGNLIRMRGVVDTNLPWGTYAAVGLERRTLGWVSVDLDDIPEDAVEISYSLNAAVSGAMGLPLADDDVTWDPDPAHQRIVAWATDDEGVVDIATVAQTHLWIEDDADATDPESYRIPFADVVDVEVEVTDPDTGEVTTVVEQQLLAIPAGIDWALDTIDEIHDRGDMSDDEHMAMVEVLDDYFARLGADLDDDEDEMVEVDEVIEASAWSQFRALPAMPAASFAEPDLADVDEYVHLTPDGSRIFGWVAQRGVCHDAYRGRCQTPPLERVDLSTFLRQPVTLDDGTEVRVGVLTMNAGHDNDGASANTARAQFDDTRTVAAIVTVGINDGGMWFSGVPAPWLSTWDAQVLSACRPSGHWRRLRSGGWSLRAVLSVPVPGFPNTTSTGTSLAASAVVERSNLALVASAVPPDEPGEVEVEVDAARQLASLVADVVVERLDARDRAVEVAAMRAALGPARATVARHLVDTTTSST